MGPVVPLLSIGLHQPKVRLVDQSRGLKSMVISFALKVMAGQATEFVINKWE